jgi:tRNA(adenine34) deaminase
VTREEFDVHFMRLALREAEKAAGEGEVPTGCVIVEPDIDEATGEWKAVSSKILGKARNAAEGLCDATAHAEMLALTAAFAKRGNWRLTGARLYVTKEPCPMCAGAIILSRVDAVVWGVSDPKRGGGTVFGIFDHPGINHHPEVVQGVLEEDCKSVLQDFFRCRRAEK